MSLTLAFLAGMGVTAVLAYVALPIILGACTRERDSLDADRKRLREDLIAARRACAEWQAIAERKQALAAQLTIEAEWNAVRKAKVATC